MDNYNSTEVVEIRRLRGLVREHGGEVYEPRTPFRPFSVRPGGRNPAYACYEHPDLLTVLREAVKGEGWE